MKIAARNEGFISINKLKTTPTPHKNGAYGGSVCHIWGVRMPYFLYKSLDFNRFYAIQTPIVWHILGTYFFANMGVGVVRIIFKVGDQMQLWWFGSTAMG